MNTKKMGISSETSWIDARFEVRVWGRNMKEADDLCQDCIVTLKDSQFGTSSTSANEIFGFTLESTNSLAEQEGEQNLVHSRIMTYKYSAILA